MPFFPNGSPRAGLLPALLLLALTARAQAPVSPDDTVRRFSPGGWNLNFQQTIIHQWHANFSAPYTGDYSLAPRESAKTSLTTTAFIGRKLWPGAEAYFDPEVAGGSGLSGARGVAGFTNGETFRIGNPAPVLYLARLYVRQIIHLPSAATETGETLEAGFNQVYVQRPARYLALTAGKFSIADFFDNNPYSHDPRTQFLNWSLMSAGGWDYPANTRGYTLGAVVEYVAPHLAVRYALAGVPEEANGPRIQRLDADNQAHQLEVERTFRPGGRPLTVRALGFYNRANMGDYRAATAALQAAPGPRAEVPNYRRAGRTKAGFGLNLAQELTADLGWFARVSWNDGRHETWAFTEIDRSASGGAVWVPRAWHRPHDALGAAVVVNGLSPQHRDYLAAGGYGFIVGDGALTYAPEAISEIYYRFEIPGHLNCSLSPDYQFVLHPAYNRARGPVHVVALRFHVEI